MRQRSFKALSSSAQQPGAGPVARLSGARFAHPIDGRIVLRDGHPLLVAPRPGVGSPQLFFLRPASQSSCVCHGSWVRSLPLPPWRGSPLFLPETAVRARAEQHDARSRSGSSPRQIEGQSALRHWRGTAPADDPQLTVRRVTGPRSSACVCLDPRGALREVLACWPTTASVALSSSQIARVASYQVLKKTFSAGERTDTLARQRQFWLASPRRGFRRRPA